MQRHTENTLTITEMPTNKKVWSDLLRLSWPPTVELILGTLLSMITMILVASLGKEAVSAVGITSQPIMIPMVVIQAFSIGGMALIARSIGMNNRNQARQACEQTMLLSIVFSIIFGIILYIWGGQIILWMGATPDYFEMAQLYMRYCAIGVIFQSISSAISSILRSAGQTKPSMYFNLIANIANVIFGLMLIYGIGIIPPLGILGAAIAQLIARIIGCAIALYTLFSRRDLPTCPTIKGIFKPSFDIIKRICKVGAPSALEQLALRVGLIAFTIYVINLGTAEFAAHNIAGTVHTFVVHFGFAISMALVSLVGQNLGAKRPDIADLYFKTAIKMALIISALLMVPLLLVPRHIAMIFTQEVLVVENIVIALRILALFTASQILQIVISGGLRGGGDTKWPLISTVSGVLGMRMILGYIFIVLLGWGIAGAWFCWFLDQTIRAIIIYFRYRSGKWKFIKV